MDVRVSENHFVLVPCRIPGLVYRAVPAVGDGRVMDRKVGAHSSGNKVLFYEIPYEGETSSLVQFFGKGDFYFPGKLGGAGFLRLLHCVP